MQTALLRQKAQMIAWPQIEVNVNGHACSICYRLVAFANMCCWLALTLHGMLASVCLPGMWAGVCLRGMLACVGFASKRDPSKHFFDRGRRRPYLPKAALICLISSCSGKRLLIVNVNFQ